MNFLANRVCLLTSILVQVSCVVGSVFKEFSNATCLRSKIGPPKSITRSECRDSCSQHTPCVGFEWTSSSSGDSGSQKGICKIGRSLRKVTFNSNKTSCHVKKDNRGAGVYLTIYGWKCQGVKIFQGYPVDGALDSGSNWQNSKLPRPEVLKQNSKWPRLMFEAINEVATGDGSERGACSKFCDEHPDCVAYSVHGTQPTVHSVWITSGNPAKSSKSFKCDLYGSKQFRMRKGHDVLPVSCVARSVEATPSYVQYDGGYANVACPIHLPWGANKLFMALPRDCDLQGKPWGVCATPKQCFIFCEKLGSLCSGFSHAKKSVGESYGRCIFYGSSFPFSNAIGGGIDFDRNDAVSENKCYRKKV